VDTHSKMAQPGQTEAVVPKTEQTAAPVEKVVTQIRSENQSRREKQAQKREEEAVWVDKARAGDQAAFRHLVETNQGRLFALAIGMLRNRDAAMDAVQESFIKAYKKLHSFEGNAAFSTWIYRICVNLCIDFKRADARRKTGNLEGLGGAEAIGEGIYSTVDILPGTGGANPVRNAHNKELGEQLDLAMASLSDEHRAVLLLREVEGMSYDEISETLEIPRGTVMSRLFHARRNMQEKLRPYLGLADEEDFSAVAKNQ
jgi:RNA polymerase sigma-70 factor, ECF subfamily